VSSSSSASLVRSFLARHVAGGSAARTVVPVTAARASDVQLTAAAAADGDDGGDLAPTLFAVSAASSEAAQVAEELQLRLYRFDKRAAAAGARVLQAAHYRHAVGAASEAAELGVALAHCENVARFWADLPANWLTPRLFVDAVRELFAGAPGVRVRVLDEHELLTRGFGGLLGVAAGSREPARLLVLDVGDVAAVPAARLPTLIGKGVTFDAGGISIKPAKDMYAMKADMTGAAAVCAAAFGAAQLGGAPCRVVVPLAENLPSASAVKPGDVLTMFDGTTVEVDNTDAEGRLLLADAVAFAAREYGARRIVTVATLTGAIQVALGAHYFGAFATHDATFDALARAAADSRTPAWRMPLDKIYRTQLRSDVADLLNCSRTPGGGACTAAWFVRSFAPDDADFAHLDIAGIMQAKNGTMTGKPTRVLTRFLLNNKL
jgi:leucyl aminopeptidase